ncbi:ABC transporter substrate-binding protein [Azohydromonas caseinilytica]|uniref:Putative aliphatic sulfonates-binding protein n=1 Tax=Azohydromonas caseinilytica TaxID=2728836 RepID=A0A848FBZ5_9BURK|nr:ABC transporter substrate-binding protein [Azohydromonas caseinilytica]NML16446.1 ABC transporter substrate-binding protein [Azohydromonas caseinilytica]
MNDEPKPGLAVNRGRRAALALGTAALAAPALVRAAGRPVLHAGDQKGGLRALLESADALKDLPYEIQWTEFPAAAPLAEALNAEAVDSGPIGDAPLIFALAQGVRIKAFAANRSDAYGTAVIVRGDSPIRDAAGLKGRSVATNRGSIGHYVTLRTLAAAGLKPSDVQFRFLTPPDAKLALVSGAVDAWATWEPYTAVAESVDGLRVLSNGRGLWSGLSYIAATDTALRDKRELLADFSQRVQRAQAWANGHMGEYAQVQARIIGIPVPAARLAFERRQTRYVPIDAAVIAEQQKAADFYLQAGLLPKRLDVEGTFTRL